MNRPKAVALRAVSKTFRQERTGAEVRAIDGMSLTVEPGEFVTLLGPSGCGKTTLLRLIAGFERPASGQILIDSVDVTAFPPERRDVGMVFQSYALFPHMTVRENLDFVLSLRGGMEAAAKKRRIREFLAMFDLSGKSDRAPHELSGGQQQRVALARSLIASPSVLLLDEPLSNLDAPLREQVRVEIKKIQKSLGITAIYVTHDRGEAMGLSDRIVVMRNGRIIQVDRPPALYADPASMYVASLIGKAVFFSGTVTAVGATCDVLLDGRPLSLPRWSPELAPGSRTSVLCRPESLVLCPPSEGTIRGRVVTSMYLGDTLEVYVFTYDGEIMAIIPNPESGDLYRAGEAVGIRIQPNFAKALPFCEE